MGPTARKTTAAPVSISRCPSRSFSAKSQPGTAERISDDNPIRKPETDAVARAIRKLDGIQKAEARTDLAQPPLLEIIFGGKCPEPLDCYNIENAYLHEVIPHLQEPLLSIDADPLHVPQRASLVTRRDQQETIPFARTNAIDAFGHQVRMQVRRRLGADPLVARFLTCQVVSPSKGGLASRLGLDNGIAQILPLCGRQGLAGAKHTGLLDVTRPVTEYCNGSGSGLHNAPSLACVFLVALAVEAGDNSIQTEPMRLRWGHTMASHLVKDRREDIYHAALCSSEGISPLSNA